MSALRKALLGSVFVMTALTISPADAAVVEVAPSASASGTSWTESVRKALAARRDELFLGVDSMKHVLRKKLHQEGVASWYGGRFHHRRTSSGQLFDKRALTAAHPTLPLGSKILVTSEETGRSVVVTVNDRGPYVRNRIIDLSQAAAERIGMMHSGVAHVTVEAIPASALEVASAPAIDADDNTGGAPDAFSEASDMNSYARNLNKRHGGRQLTRERKITKRH